MSFRVAINGYGRIGRSVLRALYERARQSYAADGELIIVAINELADATTVAHLTRYDSTHGRFPGSVELSGSDLVIDDHVIRLFNQPFIADLPWAELNVDLVLECSGSFSDRITAEQHLLAGAKRVLFSQPADTEVDATVVFGLNHHQLSSSARIVSNASCTTNCITPIIAVLDEALGISSGVITTIHSAMNDQPVIDAYHNTDLRKTRSAIQSIIPVDTEIARGIDRLLPGLAGRFEGQAIRVPTTNVSAIDLSVRVETATTREMVNQLLRRATVDRFAGVLAYTEEPLASCDFNHDEHSAIVDASQTRVAAGELVKVLAWFDNEWAYACRMLDTATYWLRQII